MLKKFGSVSINPDHVTHIDEGPNAVVVHFASGTNTTFTGGDATKVKELLVGKEVKEDDNVIPIPSKK